MLEKWLYLSVNFGEASPPRPNDIPKEIAEVLGPIICSCKPLLRNCKLTNSNDNIQIQMRITTIRD